MTQDYNSLDLLVIYFFDEFEFVISQSEIYTLIELHAKNANRFRSIELYLNLSLSIKTSSIQIICVLSYLTSNLSKEYLSTPSVETDTMIYGQNSKKKQKHWSKF